MPQYKVTKVVDNEGNDTFLGVVGHLEQVTKEGMYQLRFANHVGKDFVEHYWREEIVEMIFCKVNTCKRGRIRSRFGNYPCPYCDNGLVETN